HRLARKWSWRRRAGGVIRRPRNISPGGRITRPEMPAAVMTPAASFGSGAAAACVSFGSGRSFIATAAAQARCILRDAARKAAPQDEEYLYVASKTYLILRGRRAGVSKDAPQHYPTITFGSLTRSAAAAARPWAGRRAGRRGGRRPGSRRSARR